MSSSRHRRARGSVAGPVSRPAARAVRASVHGSIAEDQDKVFGVLGGGGDQAIYLLDPDGLIVSWNPGAERLTGYQSDEVLGRGTAMFYPPEANQAGKPDADLAIARAAGRLEEEGWQVRKDGGRYWADVVLSAIFDDDGRVWGYSKLVRDLSVPRAAAENLRRSEERLRLLVEAVQDYAIVMLDPQGRVTTWSSGAQRLNGFRSDEIVGRHFSVFYPPEDLTAEKPARELEFAKETGRVEDEGWRVRQDGTRYWANVVLSAVRDASGTLRGYAQVTRDVSLRRQAEEAAAARSREQSAIARLSVFALQSPDVVQAMRLAARLVAETLHADLVEVFELSHDRRTVSLRAAFGRPESDVGMEVPAGSGESQVGLVLATGRPVVFGDLASERRWPPRQDLLRLGVTSGASTVIHTESPGDQYGALSAHSFQRRVFSEHDLRFLSAIANVLASAIARVRAEERVREAERAAEMQRMRLSQAEAALRERDEFLSVAAHELRTPITALRLRLQSLEQTIRRGTNGDQRVVAEKIQRAMRNTTRLALLVERLLDVSRIVSDRLTINREPVDMAQVSEEVVEDSRELAAVGGCELRLHLLAQPRAEVDRLRVEQVLSNLLSNAIKYGAGQPVDVTLDQRGEAAVLEVRDRGIGIEPQDLGRIFERFERVAPPDRYAGLGLGLYIARRVVEVHGGTIHVRSEPGQGATFEVTLPLRPP